MPVPAAELAAQLRVTQAFINTRPETVVLVPMDSTPDGKGGTKKTPGTPRPPQQVRFIESSSARGMMRVTELGRQYSEEAIILCMPDVSIAADDEFVWDGDTWRVDSFEFPNEWSVRATVLRYGRK